MTIAFFLSDFPQPDHFHNHPTFLCRINITLDFIVTSCYTHYVTSCYIERYKVYDDQQLLQFYKTASDMRKIVIGKLLRERGYGTDDT